MGVSLDGLCPNLISIRGNQSQFKRLKVPLLLRQIFVLVNLILVYVPGLHPRK